MEKVIFHLSRHFQNQVNLSEEKAEVVAYGMAMFFSTISGLLSIIAVAWIFGVLKLALIIAITTAGLRVVSGGAHSASVRNCSLLGALISPGIALLSKALYPYVTFSVLLLLVVMIWGLTVGIVYKYAPADTPQKPITNERMKIRLRYLSMLYLMCWLGFVGTSLYGIISLSYDVTVASTLGLFWQSFSLTPWGYKLVARIDDLLP